MTDPTRLTSRTPRHGLPLLFAGQAQKEFTLNEAIARLDLLLHPAVSEERPDPPANPEAGSCYLVATNASGAFAGQEGSIAGWDGQQWTFLPAREGMVLRDVSTGQNLIFSVHRQRLTGPVNPTGGSVVDTEARSAIAEILSLLRQTGIFS